MLESSYDLSESSQANSIDFSQISKKTDKTTESYEAYEERPRMAIQSITNSQFPSFSHFFVCVTKAFNLVGCSMKSLQLKIRVIPSLPIIETNTIWCIDSDVNFRCGYALDFKKYANYFNLGDYTPVIEFYRKQPDSVELFGFSLLPLSVVEKTECAGKPLTYLYKNQAIDIRQFTTGQIIGYLTVTIALGYPQHQQFIDPDSNLPTPGKVSSELPQSASQIPQTVPTTAVISQQANLVNIFNNEDEEEEEENDSHERHRRRHHRRRKKRSDWTQKAIAYGWKPPGYVDPEWKEKAKEKGWYPPNIFSSIGVTCCPTECPNLKDIEVQQDEIKILKIEKSSENQTTDYETATDSDDSTMEIFKLLNNKPNINSNKLNTNQMKNYSDSSSDLSLSSVSVQAPECSFTPILTIFEKSNLLNIENQLLDEGSLINTSSSSIDTSLPEGIDNILLNLGNKIGNDNIPSQTNNKVMNYDKIDILQLSDSSDISDSETLDQITNQIFASTPLPTNQLVSNPISSGRKGEITSKPIMNVNDIIPLKTNNISELMLSDSDSDDLSEDPLEKYSDLLAILNKSKNEIKVNNNNINLDLSDSDQEIMNQISSAQLSTTSSINSLSDSSDTDDSDFIDYLHKKEPSFVKIFNIANE
ncbi:hypothetical protein TRFO_36591 [Tritrichomonas foetus]|uniref:Uncharacterized protein n=1 Tax=Tritrichomonas foetus TaxID=1144522 RepID=A0A1J4JEW2_9EUKA|nr:hypothetical protein TRFO_36591 [Tritrichomonas foetus]|eukprot:OHS97209.1 hypothetical protein TRFO_36591 [Tritrichomonas foetus]